MTEQDGRIGVAPGNTCDACHHLIDAAATVIGDEDARPEPGDVTICAFCVACLIFTNDGTTRVASPDDLRRMRPSLRAAICRSQMVIRRRLSRN